MLSPLKNSTCSSVVILIEKPLQKADGCERWRLHWQSHGKLDFTQRMTLTFRVIHVNDDNCRSGPNSLWPRTTIVVIYVNNAECQCHALREI